jgi:hypothetical protein
MAAPGPDWDLWRSEVVVVFCSAVCLIFMRRASSAVLRNGKPVTLRRARWENRDRPRTGASFQTLNRSFRLSAQPLQQEYPFLGINPF